MIWLLATSASAMPVNNPNLELHERTGENPFARNIYICDCTLEEYLAVPLPGPNWKKNTTATSQRTLIADEFTNVSPAPPTGTPATLDLIPEIPGPDHRFIARAMSGSVLGVGAQGAFLSVQVQRGFTWIFHAGSIVHTVTDPSGTEFVLFSMDGAAMATYDPSLLGGLSGLDQPVGWSYASEILASELVVVTPSGVANLYASGNNIALWQELVVPEPVPALSPTGLGLLGGLIVTVVALVGGLRRSPSQ